MVLRVTRPWQSTMRLPFEVDKDYPCNIGECITRPMTDEEKQKYGVAKAPVTDDAITPINHEEEQHMRRKQIDGAALSEPQKPKKVTPEEFYALQQQVQQLTQVISEIMPNIDNGQTANRQLQDLANYLRTNPNLDLENDLTKEDLELLKSIDAIVTCLFNSNMDDLNRVLDDHTILIDDLKVQAFRHRHQLTTGLYSELPTREIDV